MFQNNDKERHILSDKKLNNVLNVFNLMNVCFEGSGRALFTDTSETKNVVIGLYFLRWIYTAAVCLFFPIFVFLIIDKNHREVGRGPNGPIRLDIPGCKLFF